MINIEATYANTLTLSVNNELLLATLFLFSKTNFIPEAPTTGTNAATELNTEYFNDVELFSETLFTENNKLNILEFIYIPKKAIPKQAIKYDENSKFVKISGDCKNE